MGGVLSLRVFLLFFYFFVNFFVVDLWRAVMATELGCVRPMAGLCP